MHLNILVGSAINPHCHILRHIPYINFSLLRCFFIYRIITILLYSNPHAIWPYSKNHAHQNIQIFLWFIVLRLFYRVICLWRHWRNPIEDFSAKLLVSSFILTLMHPALNIIIQLATHKYFCCCCWTSGLSKIKLLDPFPTIRKKIINTAGYSWRFRSREIFPTG